MPEVRGWLSSMLGWTALVLQRDVGNEPRRNAACDAATRRPDDTLAVSRRILAAIEGASSQRQHAAKFCVDGGGTETRRWHREIGAHCVSTAFSVDFPKRSCWRSVRVSWLWHGDDAHQRPTRRTMLAFTDLRWSTRACGGDARTFTGMDLGRWRPAMRLLG